MYKCKPLSYITGRKRAGMFNVIAQHTYWERSRVNSQCTRFTRNRLFYPNQTLMIDYNFKCSNLERSVCACVCVWLFLCGYFCVNWGYSDCRRVCPYCVGCQRDVLWIVWRTFALFLQRKALCTCCIVRDIRRCLYCNQRLWLFVFSIIGVKHNVVFLLLVRILDSPDVCRVVVSVWSTCLLRVSD